MTNNLIKRAFLAISFTGLALFLVQCNTPAENKAPALEAKMEVVDSTAVDSSANSGISTKMPQTPLPAKADYAKFTFKSTRAVIKGASSLHAWESKITQMDGKGVFKYNADKLIGIQDMEIKIPVKSIKSKEGKKMDNKTYDTFDADKNPTILYTVKNAVVNINASNKITIEASGKLTMAGVTQPVSLKATGKKLANGDLQLSLSQKINMIDYKMDPPVMMLGTIKVGKEISLYFDFILIKTN